MLNTLISIILGDINKLKQILYPDFVLEIGLVSIFSHSEAEYQQYLDELSMSGTIHEASNGKSFKLNNAIVVNNNSISEIRVRKPDIHRHEIGCCDLICKPEDYSTLREIALSKGLDIIIRKDYEMIELATMDLNVYAYIVKDN